MEAIKVNVRATINELEIGESAEFPISRIEYVLSCRTRLQERSEKRFTSSQDKIKGVVNIERTYDKPRDERAEI